MAYRILTGVVILLVFFAAPTAYGQTVLLTINIDRTEFKSGDTINISGQVGPVNPDERILIRVYGPTGVLTRIEPLYAADGSYAYNYTIDGPLNDQSGKYRVVVTYHGVTKESTFTFVALDQKWQLLSVNLGDNTHDIRYAISGAVVEDITADLDLATTLITISSSSDGAITLQLPTAFLSQLRHPTDVDFVVFTDSIPAEVYGSLSGCIFEITVPFEQGTEEIELVGSWLPAEPLPNIEDPQSGAISRSFISIAKFEAEDEEFTLPIKLDAIDCNFSFHQGEKRLQVNITGSNGELGYLEITLPHRFLGGNYTVLLEGIPVYDFETRYNPSSDGLDSTTVFLFYDPDKVKSIDIIGTTSVPEFRMTAFALIALSFSLLAIVGLRHRAS